MDKTLKSLKEKFYSMERNTKFHKFDDTKIETNNIVSALRLTLKLIFRLTLTLILMI